MTAPISAVANVTAPGTRPVTPKLEIRSDGGMDVSPADGAQFRAALDRRMASGAAGTQQLAFTSDNSLGNQIFSRATELSSGLKKEQVAVSKALEQATRTGDSMQLMKAMMALSDYQMRVQAISKTVSKGVSALDSLTKLQ